MGRSRTRDGIFEYNRPRPESASRTLRARREANEKLTCVCPSCTKNRGGLSIYCVYHYQRYRRNGCLTDDLPNASELRVLEGVIRDWITTRYLATEADQRGFKALWSSALSGISKSQRYAVSYSTLEGVSGFTSKTKGSILLSWYQHRAGQPLGAALLRYLAVRLWAELKFTLPPGKTNLAKERHHLVATVAGKFVIRNSGFSKSRTVEKIVGWQRDYMAPNVGEVRKMTPIKEIEIKNVCLTPLRSAPIARAIGSELRVAAEHVLGPSWSTDSVLKDMAENALRKHKERNKQ